MEPSAKTQAGNKKWRRVLIGSGAAVALLAIIVSLLPTILSGSLGKRLLVSQLQGHVRGKVDVKSLQLGWGAPLSVTGLEVSSESAGSATMDASIDRGLLSLCLGGVSGARIECAGSIKTTYGEDGTLSIGQLLITEGGEAEAQDASGAPRSSEKAVGEFVVPAALRGMTLVLGDLTIEATPRAEPDASAVPAPRGGLMALRNISGTVALDSSGSLKVDLHGTTVVNDLGGELQANIVVDHIVASDGKIQLKGASLTSEVKAEALPIPAMGAPVDVRNLNATITASDLAAELSVVATAGIGGGGGPNADASVNLKVTEFGSLLGQGDRTKLRVSGHASAQRIPSGMLGPFLVDSGIDPVRDIGDDFSIDMTFDQRSITAEVKGDRLQLGASGELAADGMAWDLPHALLQSQLSPSLLAATVGLETDAPVSVTVACSSLHVPVAPFDFSKLGMDAAVTIGETNWKLPNGVALHSGSVTLTAQSAAISSGIIVDLKVMVQGVAAHLNGRCTLAADDPSDVSLDGAISTGPIDLNSLGWIDSATRAQLLDLGLNHLSLAGEIAGGIGKGTATLSLSSGPTTTSGVTSITAVTGWDESSLGVTKLQAQLGLSQRLMTDLTGGTVALGSAVAVTVGADQIRFQRATAKSPGAAPSTINLTVQTAALDIAKVPGVVGPFVAKKFNCKVGLALSDQSVTVDGTFDLASQDGAAGSWQFEYSGKSLWARAEAGSAPTSQPNSSSHEVAAKCALSDDGLALCNLVDAAEYGLLLSGPGTIQADCTFGSSTEIRATVALPRTNGTVAMGFDSQGHLRLGPSSVRLSLPQPLMANYLKGDATKATETLKIPAATAADDVSLTASITSFDWMGEMATSNVTAELLLAPIKGDPLSLGESRVSVKCEPLGESWMVSGTGTLREGSAAAMPITISAQFAGDLGMLLGQEKSLRITKGIVKIQAPGDLIETTIDLLDEDPPGTPDSQDTEMTLSNIDLTVDIASLTVPMSKSGPRLADATVDAGLALARTTVRVGKSESASLGPITLKVKSDGSVGANLITLVQGSVESTDGGTSSVDSKLSFQDLGLPDGSLGTATMGITGTADIASFPLVLVDAFANDDGMLTRFLGDTVSLHATAAQVTVNGVASTKLAATLTSPHLAVQVPAATIDGGALKVIAAAPVNVSLTLNDSLRQDLLQPLNPIFADIKNAPPIKAVIDSLSYPLNGDLSKLNGHVRMEVGDVTVVKSNQLFKVLKFVQGATDATIPAHIDPLDLTISAGRISYQDWGISAGKTGAQWTVELDLSGDIDLSRKPPWANAITCTYPLDSMARTVAGGLPGQKISDELSDLLAATPLGMLDMIKVQLIFSGPLGQVNGKSVPLDMRVGAKIGNPLDSAGSVLKRIGDLFPLK